MQDYLPGLIQFKGDEADGGRVVGAAEARPEVVGDEGGVPGHGDGMGNGGGARTEVGGAWIGRHNGLKGANE